MNKAVLKKDGTVLVENVEVLDTVGGRMKGLLGRSSLPEGQAVYLAPCGSIHTFFMTFSLDLFFVTRDMTVCRIERNVRPWRMVFAGGGAVGVIEMQTGWLPVDALSVGDKVELGY